MENNSFDPVDFIKDGYIVYYLGHSAWIVQTSKHFLIFDYSRMKNSPHDLGKIQIDIDRLSQKEVILFFSHIHYDHYDENLHNQCIAKSNATAVLGGFESGLENTITVCPREIVDMKDVRIKTGNSTDAGVCFLIYVDHFVIFFGGDNADWGDGDVANQMFYEEIDFISSMDVKVDIAFIPVCTSGGERPSDLTKGAIYTINKLNPARTFPMHGNGKEYLYKEFANDAKDRGCMNDIVCMEKAGERYIYKS